MKAKLVDFNEYLLLHSSYRPYEYGRVSFFSTMEMPEKRNIRQQMKRLYYFVTDPSAYEVDIEKPIILWDRASVLEELEVLSKISATAIIYNNPKGITVSKEDTIKLLQKAKCPHLPKTVFDRDKAKTELEFPIIAKASNTFQSRGVEKVDTKTALDKLPGGFDLYQQQIEIKAEFRLLFFRSKNPEAPLQMLAAFRRDPLNKKAKSLRVNEAGMYFDRLMDRAKSDFAWTQVDPHKYMDMEETYKLASHVFSVNPGLHISGIDMAVDKNGKHWFIEQNSTPGMFSNQAVLIYRAVYEDSVGVLSKQALENMVDLSKAYAKLTLEEEKGFSVESESLLQNLYGFPL